MAAAVFGSGNSIISYPWGSTYQDDEDTNDKNCPDITAFEGIHKLGILLNIFRKFNNFFRFF